MKQKTDIVLDEYEQSVEDALDTLTPVSPETRRRLDAILAHEQERQGGVLDAGGVSAESRLRLSAQPGRGRLREKSRA